VRVDREQRERIRSSLKNVDPAFFTREVSEKYTAAYRDKLRRLDTNQFMRALIRFAWENLAGFATPALAIETIFDSTHIVPEYPESLFGAGGDEMLVTPLRAPKTMAPLRRLQDELRHDLAGLVAHFEPHEYALKREVSRNLDDRINARVPRLRFWSWAPNGQAFTPHVKEPLDRVLYYGLGLALSRGVRKRMAACSYCGRPVVRGLERREKSGRAFCLNSNRCRNAFHNQNKTREERAHERRITRAKATVKQPRAAAPAPSSTAAAPGRQPRPARAPTTDRARAPRTRPRTSTPARRR